MKIITALTLLSKPIQFVLISGNSRPLGLHGVIFFSPSDLPNNLTEISNVITLEISARI